MAASSNVVYPVIDGFNSDDPQLDYFGEVMYSPKVSTHIVQANVPYFSQPFVETSPCGMASDKHTVLMGQEAGSIHKARCLVDFNFVSPHRSRDAPTISEPEDLGNKLGAKLHLDKARVKYDNVNVSQINVAGSAPVFRNDSLVSAAISMYKTCEIENTDIIESMNLTGLGRIMFHFYGNVVNEHTDESDILTETPVFLTGAGKNTVSKAHRTHSVQENRFGRYLSLLPPDQTVVEAVQDVASGARPSSNKNGAIVFYNKAMVQEHALATSRRNDPNNTTDQCGDGKTLACNSTSKTGQRNYTLAINDIAMAYSFASGIVRQNKLCAAIFSSLLATGHPDLEDANILPSDNRGTERKAVSQICPDVTKRAPGSCNPGTTSSEPSRQFTLLHSIPRLAGCLWIFLLMLWLVPACHGFTGNRTYHVCGMARL